MSEVDLLDRYPRTTRDIAARAAAVPAQRDVAMRFAREYFDGERGQGYGGYRYDGRWVPVAERIRDHYRLQAGARVLDIGCAKGFLLHDLRRVVPGLRVTGLDISSYALASAMEDVRTGLVRGSADRLPFADKSFDLVVSINTIHNLDRAGCIRALGEMERVGRLHRGEVRALAAHRADVLGPRRMAPPLRGGRLPRRLLLDGDGVRAGARRERP